MFIKCVVTPKCCCLFLFQNKKAARKEQITFYLHIADKGDGSSELFVDHEAKDAHLGGTAVVELDGTLGKLGLLGEGIPAEVEGAVAEVTGELGGSGDVLHDGELEEADEEDDLDGGASGDGVGAVDGGPAVGEGVKGITGVVEVSGKVDSGTGDDVAEESLVGGE